MKSLEIKDETGKKYGMLLAVRFDKRIGLKTFWVFKCDCGEEISRGINSVKTSYKKYKNLSCGCARKGIAVLDEKNNKYGLLTAIKFYGVQKGKAVWVFKCDCGGEVIRKITSIKYKGANSSCGCQKRVDLKGKYGMLTPIKYTNSDSNGNAKWLVQCDCGSKPFITWASSLTTGHTKTCGCVPPSRTHGQSYHRLYSTWWNMKQRCDNPKSLSFSRYGGRGITYIKSWSKIENFLNDMADGFKEGLSMDRIDNDGNYCPENCRWATWEQQANNKSNSKKNKKI